MKKLLVGILGLAVLGAIVWLQIPYIKSYYISNYNFQNSSKYQELDALLGQWCDRYYFVKPTLYMRFNSTNEAYYANNQITLLVTLDTYLYNPEFLEVAMAHEFGHHYSYIKMENLDEKMEELFADSVALKLIGLDKMKRVLEKKENQRDGNEKYLSNSQRVKFLEKVNLDSLNL